MSVRVARDGPVATLILDRPAVRNAVDRPTAEALVEAVRAADADPAVRALVLTGAGDTFCAGADLGAFTTPRRNRVAPDGDGPMGPTRLRTAKPVIAAIEGHAVAGGLEFACWADLRVVADDAVLGVFCRRWGVPLIDGGTVRLPRLIGLAHALDLILTGRPVHADEALRIGLATRVVPAGTARAEAEALAHRLAAFPATCLRGDLAAARGAFDLPEEAALRAELERGLAALDDPETHAAVARFVGGAGRHGEGV